MTSEINIAICEQCKHIYTVSFIPEDGVEYVCSPCMSVWIDQLHDLQGVTFQSIEDYEKELRISS